MNKIKVNKPKYEYLLHTWGGFYNKKHQEIHKKESGYFWFDTEEERESYLNNLKRLSSELNAHSLVYTKSEGFHTRLKTICHRVIEYKSKHYYSINELGYAFPFSTAKYIMEYKWTPGFNDYPLGEDFDYENNDIKIIQEWITGADAEIEQ